MRIAVVGTGIAGLVSAALAARAHEVTVFEAGDYVGGHTHTHRVERFGRVYAVDSGFIVFNERTYPNFIRLLDGLGVASHPTTMSFSVRDERDGLEYNGTDLNRLFAQRRNLLRPSFLRMLADIARFNRETTTLERRNGLPDVPLGVFLDARGYGTALREWYLLPMAAAIWSAPRREILGFPLPAFVRFCHNHGLLRITDRPQWRTVLGGGRAYVLRILRELHDVRLATPVVAVRRTTYGVEIDTPARHGERFDAVVLACHSDQSLALLADASPAEARALRRVRYQPNRVVLHTDARLLPRARRAWSAWNYLAADDPDGSRPVAVSYLINRLQPLPFPTPVIVTLNPCVEPDAASIVGEYEYAHPLLDAAALAGQAEIRALQGARRTWFAGAWLGYGFHEDGLASAYAAADSIALHAEAWSDVPARIAA